MQASGLSYSGGVSRSAERSERPTLQRGNFGGEEKSIELGKMILCPPTKGGMLKVPRGKEKNSSNLV